MLNRFNKINFASKLLNGLTISSTKCTNEILPPTPTRSAIRVLSITAPKRDLMEFFDDKAHWGKTEVKSGRSWRKEELRLKSNADLHKLWYVLLKERNMLLTMEEEAKEKTRYFASPERIDKVQDSMDGLEEVIRERNLAYYQLETGETGERPGKLVQGPFGLRYFYKQSQYVVPKHMNTKWKENYKFYKPDQDTNVFLSKYYEKLYLNKKRKRNRDFNHVVGLMNRFPNMDMEALREQYPEVDIEKAKKSRKYRGHFVPK